MIGRLAAAGAAAIAAVASVRALRRVAERGGDRLLAGPRTLPDEAALAPAVDALGGEVVRLRARDGVRLAGRWLPAEHPPSDDATWRPDPHHAILLLHGYSGSIAPDLVEYGPFLRRIAGVLGLDFRGHGESEDGPTTFGVLEIEDVAGALAWLGERGISRVSLVGTSMGGIVAIASVAVLGDGSLAAADLEPDAPRDPPPPPRPRIVAIVADSVAPDLVVPIASRVRGPASSFVAARLFDAATRRLGADPRDTEPGRVIGLVEPVPLLLIHGEADEVVPIADGRRLAAMAGPSAEHWTVPGAPHSGSHGTDPEAYERRVTEFLRHASADAAGAQPILAASGPPAPDPEIESTLVED
ncbi:MAG TPA: alpha/beta hydrolase [Candidatus Saccharimonadales bacterium]|nr:alpha/beta hydrolase [Candidatus Saccharimonadales bacterium]